MATCAWIATSIGIAVYHLGTGSLVPVYEPMEHGTSGVVWSSDGGLVLAAADNDLQRAHSNPTWSDHFITVSAQGEVGELGPQGMPAGPLHSPVAP